MALDTPRRSDTPTVADQEAIMLDGLCREVQAINNGLRAKVVEPLNGSPFLRVTNTVAADLAEDIRCRSLDMGHEAGPPRPEWWFLWSWGESIGLADDLASVAKVIAHVLRARS